jgi:hypothetical protein
MVPPGAVDQTSIILFQDLTAHEIDEQGHESMTTSYNIDFPKITGYPKLKKEMIVHLFILKADTAGQSKIYHRRDESRSWAVIPFEQDAEKMIFSTRESGFFCIQNTRDDQPPEIDIQIENQPYTGSNFVSHQPSISIIIRDESGVDIRPGKIIIELNGQVQEESHFSSPDSLSDQKQIVVTYRPSLRSGENQVLIMASDIHGNVREPQLYRLRASNSFDVQFMGNYPNPFKRTTTFVYTLTDMASELSLKIYTVSGRLVKVFDDYELAAPDYHELIWDGTDEYGNEVANGVYFFKLDAKNIQGDRQITGTLAKVR